MFTFTSATIADSEQGSLTEYAEGFDDGFAEGWRDVKGSLSLAPLPPLPPLPQAGRVTYRDGYNAGFKQGRRRALNNRI